MKNLSQNPRFLFFTEKRAAHENTPIKAALVTPVPTFFVAILLTFALFSALFITGPGEVPLRLSRIKVRSFARSITPTISKPVQLALIVMTQPGPPLRGGQEATPKLPAQFQKLMEYNLNPLGYALVFKTGGVQRPSHSSSENEQT
jgi:hypothetical protein